MAEQEITIKVSCLQDLVEGLLIHFESLRSDDNALVANVWGTILNSVEGTKELAVAISDAMKLIDQLRLPSYDTITRIRRDVQRKRPELRPKEPIRELRKQKQERIENDLRHAKDRAELDAWRKKGENKKHE